MIKKIGTFLTIAAVSASMASTVFAADPTINANNGTAASTVQIAVNPDFTVTIPETIVASKDAATEISITGTANMDSGNKVSVTVATGDVILKRHTMDGATELTDTNADSITAKLKKAAAEIPASITEVASFTQGATNGVAEKLTVDTIVTAGHKAGMYKGTVTFTATIKPVV